MSKRIQKILSALLIIGVPVIVIVIGLCSGDLAASWEALQRARPVFLVCAISCYAGYLMGNGLSLIASLRSQGYRFGLGDAFITSCLGQYYSNITPSASGGQPMQIYRMHKRDIPIAVATSATVMHFIAYQIMITVLTTALGIAYWQYIYDHLRSYWFILLIVYLINALSGLGVMMLSCTRRPVRFVLRWIVRLGERFRLLKDPQATHDKLTQTHDRFYDSMRVMLHHKGLIAWQMLICGLQAVALMSVLYFVYRALGFYGFTWPFMVAMSFMELISAAYAPMPGASGARESVFTLYFGQIFPGSTRIVALLIWRFISYYLLILIVGGVQMLGGLFGARHRHEAEAFDPASDAPDPDLPPSE